MTKNELDKKVDDKIKIFSEKVDKIKHLFNEIVLDRKEILELIAVMEKNNWISDKDRIDAIKMRLNEVKPDA